MLQKKIVIAIEMVSAVLFSIYVQAQSCVGLTRYSTNVGTITDGSGSNFYDNGMDCKWLIQPTAATTITITFTDFDTEYGSDIVRVYDGATTEKPLLGEFSGSSLPSNITSTGESVLISFISDGSTVGNGWSLNYTSLGGGTNLPVVDFEADKKTIYSGESIIFSDATSNSPASFLWSFEGGNPVSSTQPNPTVTYSSIGIHDVSLEATNALGNSTKIKTGYITVLQSEGPCSGTTILTSPTANISDGSGSSYDYYDNSNCKWLIQPANATNVSLVFTSFSVDPSDFVKVYDGSNTSATLLGSFNGFNLPQEVISTGPTMLIHFTSNANYVAQGWEAFYTTYLDANFMSNLTTIVAGEIVSFTDLTTLNPTQWHWNFPGGTPSTSTSQNPVIQYNADGYYNVELIASNGAQTDTIIKTSYIHVLPAPTCSGMLQYAAPSDVITDGSGSNNYSANLDCSWLIQPIGSNSIILTFTTLNTELNSDLIRIYDGASTSAPLLAELSGNQIPLPISSSGGSMLISFTTDGGTSDQGWEASYTSSGSSFIPVADFVADSVTIFSGHDVHFTDITTNSPTSWAWSFPGGIPSSSTIQNPIVVYNNIGDFEVKLIASNSFGSDTVIKINYVHVIQPSGQCGGTTILNAQNATFSDGSGSNLDYYNNADCKWLIQPSTPSAISLMFTSFNIDNSDFVNVYDGSNSSAPLIGSYTGPTLPDEIISTGNSLFVRFFSDANWVAQGWEAFYATNLITNFSSDVSTIIEGETVHFYDHTNLSPTTWNWFFQGGTPSSSSVQNPQITYTNSGYYDVRLIASNGTQIDTVNKTMYIQVLPPTQCAGTVVLTAVSDTIDDGSYTGNYENNLDCNWLINPANAYTIELTFNSFATESNSDFVEVYDGANTSSPLLGSYSGNTIPPTLHSTSNAMLMRFISDASTIEQGWSAIYSSVVSIEKQDDKAMIVFPNPIQDYVEIQFRDYNSSMQLEISNIFGQIVYWQSFSDPISAGEKKIIQISSLAKGLYFLTVRNNSSVFLKRKIIKMGN